MYNIFYTILITIGLFFLWACNNPQPGSEKLLERAVGIVEAYPDSALRLIDSLFYPEKSLDRKEYMLFLVTQVQAKYKAYRPIQDDTLVFRARDYYSSRRKEPRMAALAWFYSGCVYREREEYGTAAQYYKEAETYSAKSGDISLQGLIRYNSGDLLVEQGLHREALEKYKEAAQLLHTEPGKQANCMAAIGRMFFLSAEKDSAFLYLHKGLEIAEAAGDTKMQNLLAQNLSVAYTHEKQFDKAETYLRQSFLMNPDSAGIPRYNLNFANLYTGMGLQDSAVWYMEQLKQDLDVDGKITDINLKASIYSFLAVTEKEKGNFNAAFDYQDKHTNVVVEIMEARLQQSVYEVQRKYDYEVMRNLHQHRQNNLRLWAILLLSAIAVGGSTFSWYTFRQRNKHLRTQRQIEILRGMAAELNNSYENKISAKERDLRELLLWKFDIVKKSALLDQYSESKLNAAALVKLFHNVVYQGNKSGHWQNIVSVFDEMNSGVSEKIRSLFPHLSETGYKIMLLTYAGMSVREISIILCLSPNTVQTYRSGLRKKFGIDNLSTDTFSYLKDVLDNK